MNILSSIAHKPLANQEELETQKEISARSTKQRGFTLIELIIVVAIIGILAAVTIPAYTDYLKRGKVSEAIELLGALKTPAEEYYASKGAFPADLSLLTDKTSGKYVSNMAIILDSGDCVIIDITINGVRIYICIRWSVSATMKDNTVFPGTINTAYEPSSGRWHCYGSPEFPDKYLPSTCK